MAGCKVLEEINCLIRPQDPFYPDLLYAKSAITIEKCSKQNPSGDVIGLSKTPAEQYIEDVRDSTLNKLLEGKWQGATMPAFHLGRLALAPFAATKSEIIALHFEAPVVRGQHKALAYLASDQLRIGSPYTAYTVYLAKYYGPGDYLFKFVGIPSEIAKAKELVERERIWIGAMFKSEIVVVDPEKAVFPTSQVLQTLRGTEPDAPYRLEH
jgi:hypothetical protein